MILTMFVVCNWSIERCVYWMPHRQGGQRGQRWLYEPAEAVLAVLDELVAGTSVDDLLAFEQGPCAFRLQEDFNRTVRFADEFETWRRVEARNATGLAPSTQQVFLQYLARRRLPA